MGFKKLFSAKEKPQKKVPPAKIEKKSPICDIFKEGIYLKQEFTERLLSRVEKGADFFDTYNESRMKLAFDSFTETMKLALFEIIFFLNNNETWMQDFKYRVKALSGSTVTDEGEGQANLYVKGAPHGIRGTDSLSPVFKDQYEAYIQKEFGQRPLTVRNGRHFPIDGVYSIGSIGTIGHKQVDSDLDLQIEYDLEPFLFKVKEWSDDFIKSTLKTEYNRLIERYFQKKQIDPKKVKTEAREKVKAFFKKSISSKYPILYRYFIAGKKEILKNIVQTKENKMRSQLIREIINLMKLNARTTQSDSSRENEKLLKERILKIQDYIQRKFPDEEIYLFPFSLHEFRKGHFSSTLESKESSGGAYELLLNYETLMPGIYFTPNIPSHFIFPPDINNNQATYDKLIEYLRFGVVDVFDNVSNRIINQGSTPDLNLSYVADHYSAVYWEAFKASYGNLPKATLNLLRYEILLEKKINKTIIQLIKQPELLDDLAFSSNNIESVLITNNVMSPQQVVKLEKEFPLLSFDPWWLRFKALKIAFGVPGLVAGVSEADLVEISENIDLAFALHVRLSDIFTKPGDKKKNVKHRDQVLTKFLELAFPENTDRRTKLNATFIGDVETVNDFEKKLRKIFQDCISRVHSKASQFFADEKESDEFKLWHHYYAKNFTPKTNMIPRSILNHLQTPRGRVQIGFEKEQGWFFRSLQRDSKVGKRFETSILSLLPEEVTLIKDTKFLFGLAYCVINGYYGIQKSGTLKESLTAIEYSRTHSNIGTKYDNHLAFVRPDQIERIMQRIIKMTPPIKVGYLDCINKKRKITSLIVFLNLQKYGRISVLYRDSLDTLYADSFDIPELEKNAEKFMSAYIRLFKSVAIHKVLGRFFRERSIDLTDVELMTWVNTNSVETTHAATNDVAKERDLSSEFKEVIMSVHAPQAA